MTLKNKFNEQYYDVIAYNDLTEKPISNILAGIIVRKFNPNRVLDIGCACGYLVGSLIDLEVDAKGIDISEYAVSIAKDDVKKHLYVGDINQCLPFSDSSFDVVVCLSTIDYISNQLDVLLNMVRVLKDGGYLILGVCEKTILRSTGIIYPTSTSRYELSKNELINITKDAGLEYQFDLLNDEPSHILNTLKVSRDFRRSCAKPYTKLGSLLTKMGKYGRWIRVKIDLLIWGREKYLVFKRV